MLFLKLLQELNLCVAFFILVFLFYLVNSEISNPTTNTKFVRIILYRNCKYTILLLYFLYQYIFALIQFMYSHILILTDR
jgi:hypothetical protein